jgi:dihydroxyacetone kinase-like predicted kinase
MVIVAGLIAALRGQDLPELAHQQAPMGGLHLPQHESSKYRYCTNFAVTGSDLASPDFVEMLEQIGDSVLVVGDATTLKVHVHTDEPDLAMSMFVAHKGEVSRLDVADMREQLAARSARLEQRAAEAPANACAVVAVVNGDGLTAMYRELGAHVVEGGATLNPSTYDLLAAIHAAGAPEAIVLPNSPNVIMAAERAAELSALPARVVPTQSQQEGLLALIAFEPGHDAAENCRAVAEAAGALRTGGVARAAKDDLQGRFQTGDAVGYAGEELVAWGDPSATLRAVLAAIGEQAEVVTLIAGEGAPIDAEVIEGLLPDGAELELHSGGQAAWWYLAAAE